jgi:hypothetical protein
MWRWHLMWRWHFRYTATIELKRNPSGSADDIELLREELEDRIEDIELPNGYRIAKVKVQFVSEPDDKHLEG